MRKKDRAIKEAFQIYQTNKEDIIDDYEVGTTEGFEDKIYDRIARLNIPNPRAKAHYIWFGILAGIVVIISAALLIYRQVHRPVDVTKTMEQFYQDGYFDATTYGIDSAYGYINYPAEAYQSDEDTVCYAIRYLKDAQAQELEKSNITYRETDKVLWQIQSASNPMTCYEKDPSVKKKWKVYQLSDRKSGYYYILEDDDANMAIAQYDSIGLCKNKTTGYNICNDIFAMDSEKSVRSITLERFQARSTENSDRILSVYTSDADKKEILNRVMQAKLVEKTNQDVIDTLEKKSGSTTKATDVVATWAEITKEVPKTCYYLTIENDLEEKWVLGIVDGEDDFLVFTDIQSENIRAIALSDEDETWLQKLVEKADKVY